MPIILDGTGPISGITSINASVSSTELGFLDGVTSGIQTQINSGGLVKIADTTFSAQSTVSINNCFSSTYENYLFQGRYTTAASSGSITYRLRASGTDANTNYNEYGVYAGATGGITNNLSSQAQWFSSGSHNATTVWVNIFLFRPNVAEATSGIWHQGDTRAYIIEYAGHHTTASAYDGISISISSGSFSGTARVYGIRN